MTVFLLSLGGFPPTAGFIGKWYIFSAAVQEGHTALAIIGVLSSVVSVFFYLRIVVMMYMTEDAGGPGAPARSRCPAMAALALRADRDVLPRRAPDARHRLRAAVDSDDLLDPGGSPRTLQANCEDP